VSKWCVKLFIVPIPTTWFQSSVSLVNWISLVCRSGVSNYSLSQFQQRDFNPQLVWWTEYLWCVEVVCQTISLSGEQIPTTWFQSGEQSLVCDFKLIQFNVISISGELNISGVSKWCVKLFIVPIPTTWFQSSVSLVNWISLVCRSGVSNYWCVKLFPNCQTHCPNFQQRDFNPQLVWWTEYLWCVEVVCQTIHCPNSNNVISILS
jgi:hypothetical protein